MPDGVVVVNTSPIQYLYQAGLLETLRLLYGTIIVPDGVRTELAEGRVRGVTLPDPDAIFWITIRTPQNRKILPLVTDLGSGEREVLALAVEIPALALIDDSTARKHARLLGVSCTGTLRVILKARAAGLIPSVRPILDRLDALRFRLAPETRAAVLKIAGEAG